jgi:hypothetical protein
MFRKRSLGVVARLLFGFFGPDHGSSIEGCGTRSSTAAMKKLIE